VGLRSTEFIAVLELHRVLSDGSGIYVNFNDLKKSLASCTPASLLDNLSSKESVWRKKFCKKSLRTKILLGGVEVASEP